jgi:cytochrome P450
MSTTLFLHSNVRDPFQLYINMRSRHPVFQDADNGHWAVYSFDACRFILRHPAAKVPAVGIDGLSKQAAAVLGQLTRLRNEPHHEIARETARGLLQLVKPVNLPGLIDRLFENGVEDWRLDWVETIARRLPAAYLAGSFGFTSALSAEFIEKTGTLTSLLLPSRIEDQVQSLNETVAKLWPPLESHLLQTDPARRLTDDLANRFNTGPDEIRQLCIGNLIGLFIQAYDAGRGLLVNALLALLATRKEKEPFSREYISGSVVETLRFHPPVHTTRRVATADIDTGHGIIRAGEQILLVLAAANRDPDHFAHPELFDPGRSNNGDHLDFGDGAHECIARHFIVQLTIDTLFYFFANYHHIEKPDQDIQYEPLSNVRLAKSLILLISEIKK